MPWSENEISIANETFLFSPRGNHTPWCHWYPERTVDCELKEFLEGLFLKLVSPTSPGVWDPTETNFAPICHVGQNLERWQATDNFTQFLENGHLWRLWAIPWWSILAMRRVWRRKSLNNIMSKYMGKVNFRSSSWGRAGNGDFLLRKHRPKRAIPASQGIKCYSNRSSPLINKGQLLARGGGLTSLYHKKTQIP